MGLIDQLMARRNGIAPQIAQMQGTQMSPMPAPGQSAISGAPPAPAVTPPAPQTPPGLFARIGQGAQGYMQALQQDPDKRAALADSLAVGFNSMRLNPDAQLAEGAQQRQLLRVQERRLGAQANRTAQVLRNAGQEELASAIEANPELAPEIYGQYVKSMLNPAETYDTLTGVQVNEQLGLNVDPNGLYNVNKASGRITAVGGKGTVINVPPAVGAPPAGYENVFDEQGRIVRQQMIPGGPAEREQQELEEKALGRAAAARRAGQTVVQDITRAEALLPSIVQGSGVIPANLRATRAGIKGTPEAEFNLFKESALSNVGLDVLQEMRENSPTGGALGQVPIQQQTRLEQVLGSLNVEQDTQVLRDNLARVRNIYIDIMYGDAQERARAVELGRLDPARSAEIDTMYTPLSFDEMGRPRDGGDGVTERTYNPATGKLEPSS